MAKVSLGATHASAVAPPQSSQRKRHEKGNNQMGDDRWREGQSWLPGSLTRGLVRSISAMRREADLL